MHYIMKFLQNSNTASELLAESGYSTNQLVSAVKGLGELCVLGLTIQHIVQNHTKGDLLPSRFELEYSIEPMKLQRMGEVDLLKSLEEHNVIISLGTHRYRAMLSATLNRLFALTAKTGDVSIRTGLSGFGDQGPLESALDRVEWEIIEVVHDNIDVKYLEINDLETHMKPQELLNTLSKANDLSTQINELGGWDDIQKESTINLLKDRKISGKLKEYFSIISELSTLVQTEVETQKNLIGRFSTYPRSFVGRKNVPLVGSSWNNRSDFKDHPLIQKFLLLIESNHAKLAGLADIYEDYIREFADGLKNLPAGIDTLTAMDNSNPDFPSTDDMKSTWSIISRASDALLGQAKFVEVYLASIDTLFK
ncbi:MAG: hypothetical protein E4H14_02620 [Candidatus Thorarchaeota archaeon]|nr:MAG: hypothetical protein E4H14_02620 [Candidatus Thorarchaeota archaeon]